MLSWPYRENVQPVRRLRRHLPTNGEDRGRSGCPTHPRRAGPPPHLMVRRDELDALVCLDHLPSTFMNQAVVVAAERKQLAQVGRTTVRPELDVMGVVQLIGRSQPGNAQQRCLAFSP